MGDDALTRFTIEELLGCGWQDEIFILPARPGEEDDPDLRDMVDLAPFEQELALLLIDHYALFDPGNRRFEDLMVDRDWHALPSETRELLTHEIAMED